MFKNVSDQLVHLNEQYPSPDFIHIIRRLGVREAKLFIQIWLTEGIPFFFRENPVLYGILREGICSLINVNPKEISLVGSARLGYSIADKKFGRSINKDSDLDLLSVNEVLFNRIVNEFEKWKDDFNRGYVRPKNSKQEFFWKENVNLNPINISKGFIDINKIPYLNRYQTVSSIANLLFKMKDSLKSFSPSYEVKCLKLRAYKNWDSAIKQIHLSFIKK